MKTQTIRALNQLNHSFYSTVAIEFDQTRQSYWLGWQQIIPFFPNTQDLKLFDLGCGNARWASFITEQFPQRQLTYYGADNSSELLEKATQRLAPSGIKFFLEQHDIVEQLLKDEPLQHQKFEVITVFGVMHHIPSFELRKKLMMKLSDLLAAGGIICISCWQFMKSAKLKQRLVPATEVGINPGELEENDFFLDWQRGERAVRYCHQLDSAEIDLLLAGTNVTKVTEFSADGVSNNLNHYLVFSKK